MNIHSKISPATLATLSLPALALASCANAETGESAAEYTQEAESTPAYSVTEMGTFNEPWAIKFIPGSQTLVVTEKSGTLKMMKTTDGEMITVSGTPEVAYGGQGGLGDVLFLESEAERKDARTVFLSWAEMSEDGETRGAAVGRGEIVCVAETETCGIEGLKVIWRQMPKVEGRGHFSHRLAVSPDEKYLYIASGDRQKQTPAQDKTNTLGTIIRLNLDGTPAAGNPFVDEGGVTREIWSYGHRNILGMDFDAQGRLWEVEHGPAGGDELNLVKKANNYGWPTRSYGENYNGKPIPDHTADDGFTKPAAHWTPVIAPGDMIIYSGDMFEAWKGNALITGLKTKALVRVEIDGESAKEIGRYSFDNRLRSITQGPDGSIWVAEDGEDGKVLKISM